MKRVLEMKGCWSTRGCAVGVAVVMAMATLSHGGSALAQHFRLSDGSVDLAIHSGGVASMAAAGRSQGYLGIDLREVPEDTSSTKFKAVKDPRGAEIVHVDHDGPAGKAGLRERDVIQTLNGQGIDNVEQLRRLLKEMPPGRSLTMTVVREGQTQTISAQMANREEVEREAWQQHVELSDSQPAVTAPVMPRANGFFSPGHAGRGFIGGTNMGPGYTGVLLEKMAPQLAAYFGAQGKMGLLVSRVDENSPGAAAGLHAGDVVLQANERIIVNNGDWFKTIRENKGKSVNVLLLRDRHEQTVILVPNPKHHSMLLPDLWTHSGSREALKPASQVQQACVAGDGFSML